MANWLRIIAMPSVAIAIAPSSPSLRYGRSSNDDDLDLTVSRTAAPLYSRPELGVLSSREISRSASGPVPCDGSPQGHHCRVSQLSSYEPQLPLLALQLLLWEMSESMGNHDSEVVDASSVD
jgi:hypothetical protein